MEKDIGKIKKNDNTEIIVRIDDFGGRVGLTIREFTTSERYTGFTKSGTRIPAEFFKDFKEIINRIDENDLVVGIEERKSEKKGKQKKLDDVEEASESEEAALD